MKLLLTSMGVRNQSLADAVLSLAGLPADKIRIGFISTAANVEEGNKDWYLHQITRLQEYDFNWIDIIDFSADGVDWQARLQEVNVIFVSGGNTYHLLDQARKHSFDTWLKENIEKYVYIGSSAGSMLVTPNIGTAAIAPADTNLFGLTDLSALGLVPFEIAPHSWGWVAQQDNLEYARNTPNSVYCLDDASAVLVNGDETKVISEGKWELLKPAAAKK